MPEAKNLSKSSYLENNRLNVVDSALKNGGPL